MKYTTCEEYVLGELEYYKGLAEDKDKKIRELEEGIEYANRVVGLLSQLNVIRFEDTAEGKREIILEPKVKPMKIDMETEDGQYVYKLLAPLLGDEGIQGEIKAAQRRTEVREEVDRAREENEPVDAAAEKKGKKKRVPSKQPAR